MGDDYKPAAILSAGVDSFEAIASGDDKVASRIIELVAGLLEGRAVELGGALRTSEGAAWVVELPDSLAAVQCALRVLDATRESPIRPRIGIHLGDIWAFGNEAIGEGVEIAVRLRSLAAPGAIVMSSEVHAAVHGRIDLRARSLGSVELKSLGRVLEAFEVRDERAARRAGAAAGGPAGSEPQGQGVIERLLAGGSRARAAALASALPSAVERFFSPADPQRGRGDRGRPRRRRAGGEAEEAEIEGEREAASTAAFRAHLGAFGAVSVVLFLLWLAWTPFRHLWFLYPAGGWAIGVAHHFVALTGKRSQRRELGAQLTAEQRRTLRRLHREETGFAQHLTAYGTVIAFLFMVNMISSPGFPWFLFPAAGWSVGLISHRLFYTVRRRALVDRLRRLGVVRGEMARVRSACASAGRFGPLLDEARNIKESLVRQIEGSEPLRSRFAGELVPLLERYLGQINGLNERSCELEGLLSTLSEDQIDAEIQRLQAGREAARSAPVRAEYDRALAQHRQQRESLDELRGQQEILHLRIKGSVLALKRIEMDVARLKGLETAQVMGSLREKSEELSRYLEDLRAGYSELEG